MITINLEKSKEIGHEIRRQMRSAEFAPLDVQATIPMLADAAESDRQVVREKYAAMQDQIDAATTTDEIKEAIGLC